jgi:hypothetical protein
MYIYSEKELAKEVKKSTAREMRADIYRDPRKRGGITTTVALRPTGSGEIERDKSWGIGVA